MITETRKQIIELIEPYMDKTLSEGCLIRHKTINCFEILGGISDITRNTIEEGIHNGIIKIIGHYDITAVLKYIDSISDLGDIETYFSQDQINITASLWVESCNNYVDIEIDIPNKPLHLYTEKEEKDLLELLLKLKLG